MTSALRCVSDYKITLDREDGVYWSGEYITGTVTLRTNSPLTCRAVRLKLSCTSHVHWHTQSGDDRQDYDGRTKYLDYRQTLWGNFYSTALINNAGGEEQ